MNLGVTGVIFTARNKTRLEGERAPLTVDRHTFFDHQTRQAFAHHRLARFARERLLELRHVHHHAVDPVLPGRMRIGERVQTRSSLGRWFSQAHCANPMKKRWSGVKPSMS